MTYNTLDEIAERDLDVIEARANAATPGPWKLKNLDQDVYNAWGDCVSRGAMSTIPENDKFCRADAAFIAHAREDIPALVARVRELEGQVKELEFRCGDLDERLGRYMIERAKSGLGAPGLKST